MYLIGDAIKDLYDYSKDLISHRGKAFRKLIALLMPIEKNAKEDNK